MLEPVITMDALSLEYKLKYGCAIGNLDISNIVNNPVGAGICSISRLSLQEELRHFPRVELAQARAENDQLRAMVKG